MDGRERAVYEDNKQLVLQEICPVVHFQFSDKQF